MSAGVDRTRRRRCARHGRRPLVAVVAVLALVLVGCGDDEGPTDGAPAAEEPATEAPTTEAPTDAELTAAAAATRDALRDAAAAGDLDALAALVPAEGFTSNYGGEEDAIAFYRALPEDVLPIVVELLDGPSARIGDLTVWPELHARTPFVVEDAERAALEARFGAEALRGWEAAGAYLGWRIGIQDDGTWRFLVAGD